MGYQDELYQIEQLKLFNDNFISMDEELQKKKIKKL